MQSTTESGAASVSSLTETNSDTLCRGCQLPIYTKVTNSATAQSGKSWRCGACLQLFTVKSSAKRHVTNSHKDPVCRGCQEGNPPLVTAPSATTAANGIYGTQSAAGKSDGSSMDQDEEDPDEEIDLEPELALLTLMLKNHLDLKGVDSVLELLNGGMDFSGIQNASHWLQRLGKHAAVQYTTSNCPNCKRTEVQIKVDQTGGASGDGLTAHPVTLATSNNPGSFRADGQSGPGIGTVLGVFDPTSGQIITASHLSIDKNTLQKMVNSTGPGHMSAGPQQSRGPAVLAYASAPVVAAPPPTKSKKARHPKSSTVVTHPVGSVNTSWKAVARTFLYSLHSKDELLRLCVVGRRMDRTSALGLQPMEAGKRKIVGDAVSDHCEKANIPVPPDTLLNHFMSQILCDSRRKEQLMVCGGELQRRPKKAKSEPADEEDYLPT